MRDDVELSKKIWHRLDTAFRLEDEPMIIDCQFRREGADLMSLNPELLTTDAAAMRARRLLIVQIEKEQTEKALALV